MTKAEVTLMVDLEFDVDNEYSILRMKEEIANQLECNSSYVKRVTNVKIMPITD